MSNVEVGPISVEQFIAEGEECIGRRSVILEKDSGLFPFKDIVDPTRDTAATAKVLLPKEGMYRAGPVDRLNDGSGLGAEEGVSLVTGAVGNDVKGCGSGPTDGIEDKAGQIRAIEDKEDNRMSNQASVSPAAIMSRSGGE